VSPEKKASAPGSLPGPTNLLKLLQDMAAQAASSARMFADELGRASERAPEPLQRIGAQITQLSTMWVAPLQEMLKQQREFLELMASWAANQRDFADRMAKMAEDNRKMTEQLTALLAPLLEPAATARKRATRVTSATKKSG
jgi:methyl-accepting chemotaxis protein